MSESSTEGLLYPAMHKFYSALMSLEKFHQGNDFFDNITYLDAFFSEYRNITFVLQKILKNTIYESKYEELRDKYLVNELGKWFIAERNKVLKEHPFNLEKRILVTVFFQKDSKVLVDDIFTISDDKKYSELMESLRVFFSKLNLVEVYFSVEFSFFEINRKEELFDDLKTGIQNMKSFLLEMKCFINEDDVLVSKLLDKIDKINFYKLPKDILFIDDYVYYMDEDSFEKASKMEVLTSGLKQRASLSHFQKIYSRNKNEKTPPFVNLLIGYLTIFSIQKTLMPTFMIIYDDDTFEKIMFHASIKTVMYRKINEIADRIERDKIESVFFVCELLLYTNDEAMDKALSENYSKRLKFSSSESLGFFSINREVKYESYFFDSDKVNNQEHLKSVLNEKSSTKTVMTTLQPIIDEFKRLKINH